MFEYILKQNLNLMNFRRKFWYRLIKRQRWKIVIVFLVILFTFLDFIYKRTFSILYAASLCNEPIDVVYTWVNGSDPIFIQRIQQYDINYDPARFDDKNELKYSLRSLEKYAPWIAHIYIVTNGQIPKWLDLTNDRISIVPHETLTPNLLALPTFSSSAIETFIHRIPRLSKRFLYLNDDIFLGAPLYPDDLFTQSEGVQIYQAWLVPDCAEDCPWTYVGDGACDHHCNIEACQFDGGDCMEEESKEKKVGREHKTIRDEEKLHKFITQNIKIKNFPNHNAHLPIRQKTQQNFKDIIHEKTLGNISNLKDVVETFNKQLKIRSHPAKWNKPANKSITSTKDVFSQSLIYTNMILNRHYSFKARNVIAHVGFLLDKTIVEEMQQKFQTEIDRTLSHRFRSPTDLQFAFAYYYFLMNETNQTLSVAEIFNEFDTDQSMTWSDREIRTFLARTFPLPLDFSVLRFFEGVIQNCSNQINLDKTVQFTTLVYERYSDSNLPMISRDLVEKCAPLAEALQANFGTRPKYKYAINKRALYSNFMMLTSNSTEVVNSLDKLRRTPRKFNCINDNLKAQYAEENELVKHLLEDFYLSLFPTRSRYELDHKYQNRFDTWYDYQLWRRRRLIILCGSLLAFAYIILRSICSHKIKHKTLLLILL